MVGFVMDTALPSDEQLVARVMEGELSAFDDLVNRYKERLYGVLYNMTSNHEDTNDLLMEVFDKAYRSIPSFKGQSSFYTWIYRIALNLSIAESKSARARSQFVQVDDPVVARGPQFWVEESNPYAEEVVLKDKMGRLLVQMPEKHRTAVVLFYLKSMSYIEISEIMDVPVGTVKSYLFRGKAWLRERLLGNTGDEIELAE